MHQHLLILLASTVSVGLVHTLVGPDHYVPFIALSKSRNWSMVKTISITTLCGIGHIASATVLGIVAAMAGNVLARIDIIESVRGSVAAWLLTAFGFVYLIWGIRTAIKNKKHSHIHLHADGEPHLHDHSHAEEHAHVHAAKGKKDMTPWILFIIFIFGPCEPLIPLIMYPAAQKSVTEVILVTLTFGLTTLAAMITVVTASTFGIKKISGFPFFERYGNAVAGGIICTCGLAITCLGL